MNRLRRNSRLLVWLAILVLVISGAAVQAQDTDFCDQRGVEFIEYGDTVEGTIDDDAAAAVFCFEGEEGDVVIITMTATDGDLDTLVAIGTPTLDEIFAENDDISRSNSDSELEFELPDDGVYLIFATRVDLQDGDTEGDYELTLDVAGGPEPEEPSEPSQPVGVNPDLPQIVASDLGAFAVSFPEDWFVQTVDEVDSVIIGNTEEAMAGDIGRGDFSMRISFYTFEFMEELVQSESFETINESIGDEPTPLHVGVLEFIVFSASAEDGAEILDSTAGPDINGNESSIIRLDPGDRTEVFVLTFETNEGNYLSLVGRARSSDIEDFEDTIFLIAENILTGDDVEAVMGGGGDEPSGGDVVCEVTAINQANVRENASTRSSIVEVLDPGDTVTAVAQVDSGDFIWWELEDGGFVREDTVEEEGDCEDLPESEG